MIQSIVIPTKDRPGSLHRCLQSLREDCIAHGRRPDVVVVDSSPESGAQAANQAVLSEAATSGGLGAISYIGPKQTHDFLAALRKLSHIDEEILQFGLIGPAGHHVSTGASRNLGMLATRGESIVMLDDDILSPVYALAHNAPKTAALEIAPASWFFPDRTSVLGSLVPAQLGLLEAHERFLERDDTRVTVMGAAGAITNDSPGFAIYGSAALGRLKETSEEECTKLLQAAEVIRVATDPIPRNTGLTAGYCLGLDQTISLPPWFPALRSQDLVFGTVLSAVDPQALRIDLPWAVVHDRPERRQFTWRLVCDRFSRVAGGELLSALIASLPRRYGQSRSIADIGEALLKMGSEGSAAFFGRCQSLLQVIRTLRIGFLENVLSSQPEAMFLINEMRTTIDLLRHTNEARDISLIDLGSDNPFPELQGMLQSFGLLLIHWESLSTAFSDFWSNDWIDEVRVCRS